MIRIKKKEKYKEQLLKEEKERGVLKETICLKGRTRIKWCGQHLRVELSQSSCFILFWSPEALLCSLVVVFGGRMCLIRLFFAWEASWGKILTLEQLQRRGYSLANRCFLCLSEVETVDLLLLHCVKTRALWNLLFSCGLGSLWFSEGNSPWVTWSVCGENP